MTNTAPFLPFSDDTASKTVAGITIENGKTVIAFYGNATITRDRSGLLAATELHNALGEIIRALQEDPALPATAAQRGTETGTAANPFA